MSAVRRNRLVNILISMSGSEQVGVPVFTSTSFRLNLFSVSKVQCVSCWLRSNWKRNYENEDVIQNKCTLTKYNLNTSAALTQDNFSDGMNY